MSDMNSPGWDRPGDRRYSPRPQSPTQLDLSGLEGEFGPAGMSLMVTPASIIPPPASGPQPVLHVALASASNHDLDIGDLSGGRKWVVIDSAPADPSSIDGFAAGSDGVLIEVTNRSGKDLNLVNESGSAAANQILCPTNLDGTPTATTLHDRETVFLKYDASAARWRILERLPHYIAGGTAPVSSITTELARSLLQVIPCCYMGTWLTDDAANDKAKLTVGTTGKSATVTIISAVDFVHGTVESHVLTFVCGQLALIDGA
jgi:hypothetical protein